MATWQFNICRRRPRSARYYQVFGREPEYPCSVYFFQFLLSGFKCIFFYGLLFLLIKWYIWPTLIPNLMKYELVQKTFNGSSSLINRLKSNRKLSFE
ncbi:unnamed protein product [Adineta steineri]|uniref:Uncharacterized protein n=1 Tax=Adineta steineri TaxID=433720 RepID=A0A815IZB8_9BILA|nr:unnamed protein product [Adineta steineri]CAF1375580.1 unnamed protein product [Adineta steineri]CAF3627003.1 unnamed protein product [Adineta steineri]CAF4302321.1 unnamed protein product [Adineta steineri]